MIVVFQARAADDAARIDAWWREHRLDARDLFTVELEAATALAQSPTIGKLLGRSEPELRDVRRSLMNRTRYFIYYRIDDDTIEILAV